MSQQASPAAPAPSRPVLKVGVLGSGTVGTQVVRLLGEQAEEFAAHSEAHLEVTGIAVRDLAAPP